MSEVLTQPNNKKYLILVIISIIAIVIVIVIINKKRTKNVQNQKSFIPQEQESIEQVIEPEKEEIKDLDIANNLMGGLKSMPMDEFKIKAKQAGFKNIVTGEVSGKPMESMVEMKAKSGTIIVGVSIDKSKNPNTRVVKILDAKL